MDSAYGLLGFAASLAAIVAAIVAVVSLFLDKGRTRITSPPNAAENRGRYISVHGRVARPNKRAQYWLAVQPSDCREEASWWPQNEPLALKTKGSWEISQARLGRGGEAGLDDVGKTFTLAIVEVLLHAQETIKQYADEDERLRLPDDCRLLHSIEVKRVS